MKLAISCLFLVLCLASLSAFGQNTGSISGVVRDTTGKPVKDATVSLTDPRSSVLQTRSGADGVYRFAGLVGGSYTLSASSPGYLPATPQKAFLPGTDASVTADLSMSPTAAQSIPAKPKLSFEASGIHGLIDPGGYSASASADAATGLLRGIADVKRGDASFASAMAKELPCDRASELHQQLANHPESAEANRDLGEFYTAHQQPAKAIPLLKKALEINGNDDVDAKALAVAWLETGQFEQARKLLVTLTEKPDRSRAQPEMHRLLAHADEGSGLFQQAAHEYNVAYSQQPSEESRFGEAYELLLAGSAAAAATAFEAGEREYPKSIELKIGAGTAQFLTSNFSQSVDSFVAATDLDPSDPRAYPFLAAASNLSGEQKARVLSSFRRYLDLAPNDAAANLDYALILSRDAANNSRVEALLKRAIQLDPKLAKAHLQLADLLAQRGEYETAVPEYQAAIDLAPELGEVHYRLALALKRTGHLEQSVVEMRKFQQLKGNQASDSAGDEINVAQFISVMGVSAQGDTVATQCTEPQL